MDLRLRLTLCFLLLATVSCSARYVPAVPQEPTEGIQLIRAGHATVWLDIMGFRVLTDPLFTNWLLVFPRVDNLGLDRANLPPVDVAVISHSHLDHFHPPSIARLPATVPVLFPPDSDRYQAWIAPRYSREMAWWSAVTVRNRAGKVARITSVPAKHWGGVLGIDGLWNHSYGGWVIESQGYTVYFAGDTGYDPELFRTIAKRFPAIDLALLPIGPIPGRNPNARWERRHITPPQVLNAFHLLQAKVMVPIHYGAFVQATSHPDAPLDWFEELLEGQGSLRNRVAILDTGEVMQMRMARDALLVWEQSSDGRRRHVGPWAQAGLPESP